MVEVTDAVETILLVDDHHDVCEVLRNYLEVDGYTVVTATNGREGIGKLFAGPRPCLIIVRLMMPVMNGFEFREQQLKYPDLAGIPFIAISAVVDVQANAQHLKAAAYLDTPTDAETVLRVVRSLCPHERGH